MMQPKLPRQAVKGPRVHSPIHDAAHAEAVGLPEGCDPEVGSESAHGACICPQVRRTRGCWQNNNTTTVVRSHSPPLFPMPCPHTELWNGQQPIRMRVGAAYLRRRLHARGLVL